MDEFFTVTQVLLLLGVANGMPIFAKKIFGNRFSTPLDFGLKWFDGRSLFGESKTIRGVVLSVAATALAAPALGYNWVIGFLLALSSMLGDLLSSFTKRRLGLKPHSQALGLDQIPESLLPLLVLYKPLDLLAWQVITIVVFFFVLELLLSRLLYRWHVRDRPY